jgi:hypothetical protein
MNNNGRSSGSSYQRNLLMGSAVQKFIVAFLLAAACNTPAFADEKGWVLTQRSAQFGDQYVYISPSGLKLVSPSKGINIVTSAPEWNVALYNDKNKSFYSTSYGKWMQDLDRKLAGRGQDMSDRKWTKAGSTKVAGQNATQYVTNGSPRMAKSASIRHADCWISEDIAVPGHIAQMLAKVYGLPDTRTFPLKVSYVTTNGSLSPMLDTLSTQTCPFPPHYFGLPQGYKRAESEAEVMIDDETRQILNDLAGDQPTRQNPSSAPRYNQSAPPQVQQPPVQTGNNPVTPPAQTATPTAAAPASNANPSIDLGGGYSLDREKLQRIKEALMNPKKP